MITTKYKCDKCGSEQPAASQFYNVAVEVKEHGYSYPSKTAGCQWCRACAEAMHLLPVASNKPPLLTPPPTLEDLIQEIVQTEIRNSRE